MFKRYFLKIMAASALWTSTPLGGALADDTAVLTVQLPNQDTNEPRIVAFTRSDLSALPVTEFSTTTNWTTDIQHFTGLRLRDLLEHLGVAAGTLELMAMNDYSITINTDDATFDGALLAYQRNGESMSIRDKGPIWLVYNYDSSPAFRTEIIYANSIWQLDRMIISR